MHDMYEGYYPKPDLSEIYRRLSTLEQEVSTITNRLEYEIRAKMAEREYEVMERLRDAYQPPKIPPHYYRKGKEKCDFTIIGDKFVCNQCHFEFYEISNYIPPYCPSCFAKREEDG
jgi:rubrerythrin